MQEFLNIFRYYTLYVGNCQTISLYVGNCQTISLLSEPLIPQISTQTAP